MADYVSKYTGSEVDGILDEAIELPQSTNNDAGKVLTINSTGEPVWRTPSNGGIDTTGAQDGNYLKYSEDSGTYWGNLFGDVEYNSSFFEDNLLDYNGKFLKLVSSTNPGYTIWDDPIDTSTAQDGYFLKYSSDTGLMWDNPGFDTSDAQDGFFLKYSSDSGLMWCDPIDTSNAQDGYFLKYSGNTGLMWDDPSLDTSNANDGDVLKYSSDTGIMWGTILPSGAADGSILTYDQTHSRLEWAATTGSVGQVLTYVQGVGASGYTVEWADVDRLPDYDNSDNSSDAGKVLTILNNGDLAWRMSN